MMLCAVTAVCNATACPGFDAPKQIITIRVPTAGGILPPADFVHAAMILFLFSIAFSNN